MTITRFVASLALVLMPAYAFAVCGDGILDSTERCDDGNALGGDGCTALCQVEAGFACTAPVAAGDINALFDGGFDGVIAQSAWTTSAPSPLCKTASCGIGSGTGAAAGTGWAWFGGQALAATQHVEQGVLIPAAATDLRFAVENPVCDSASDVARVLLDGVEIWSTSGADASCGSLGYRDIQIDLATAPGGPYNDDASHTLRIEGELHAQDGGLSNFFFDEVVIDIGDAVPAPGVCTQEREVCMAEPFDGLAGDIASIGWTVFNAGVVARDWGTSDDGVCNSVSGPPGNHTGGDGDAACVDADAAAAAVGSGQIDAYLCTDGRDFSTIQGAALQFRLNYQVVSDADSDDIFEVLAAATAVPPSAATIGSFATVYASNGVNAGQLGLVPGEHITVDLAPLVGASSVHICFRYGGRDDWHAQVDDVAIVATSCAPPPDSDADGVTDDVDNCTLAANPGQEDSDGDGFGNICDADLNADCQTNAVDLGLFKSQFFGPGPAADFNSDGVVNAIDLGILKLLFFMPPGPNSTGACP